MKNPKGTKYMHVHIEEINGHSNSMLEEHSFNPEHDDLTEWKLDKQSQTI